MPDVPSKTVEPPLSWFQKITRFLRLHPHSLLELRRFIQAAEVAKVVDHDTEEMIEGVLNISELTVADIMVPRAQMVVLEKGKKLKEILPILIESAHSRFPVIGENKDDIVGILLAKDLLKFINNQSIDEQVLTENMLRPVGFVPETKRLDTLLKEFRSSRDHLAVVVNEYGGVSGVVTIEDVLEEIVGDIEDEFDTEAETGIKQIGEHRFTINALTLIEDFNKYFDSDFSDAEFDTMGGLITQQLGHLPAEHETLSLGQFEFTIQKADERRIHVIEVRVKP